MPRRTADGPRSVRRASGGRLPLRAHRGRAACGRTDRRGRVRKRRGHHVDNRGRSLVLPAAPGEPQRSQHAVRGLLRRYRLPCRHVCVDRDPIGDCAPLLWTATWSSTSDSLVERCQRRRLRRSGRPSHGRRSNEAVRETPPVIAGCLGRAAASERARLWHSGNAAERDKGSVTVDDDAIEVLQIGVGALVGMVGALAALSVSSRRVRASSETIRPWCSGAHSAHSLRHSHSCQAVAPMCHGAQGASWRIR